MTLITTTSQLANQLGSIQTLLILFGGDAATVAIHDVAKTMKADGKLAQRHVPLRVKNLGLLTPAQKRSWSAAEGKYVVLRVNAAAGRDKISHGSVSKFLTVYGKPGKLKILRAFRGRL